MGFKPISQLDRPMTLTREQERMVNDHVWVAKTVTKRTRAPGHVDRHEIYAHVLIGLVRAAQHFDPSLGVKFSTYAYKCCKGWARSWAYCSYTKHTTRLPRRAVKARDRYGARQDFLPANTPQPIDELVEAEEAALVRKAIADGALSEKERAVIALSLEGMQPLQCGTAMGFSRQRAGQLYRSAVEKLREAVAA